MEIILDVISGDSKINSLMHCADMFEESKQLGKYESIEVTGVNIDVNNLITNIIDAYKKCNKDVTFLSIVSIDKILNTEIKPFFKSNVNTISSGTKFALFKDILNRLNYIVETDDRMCVTNVKLKNI